MKWYSRADEHEKYALVTEQQTTKACSRIAAIAIWRWLLSGLDLPDGNASDGVSEFEAANYIE